MSSVVAVTGGAGFIGTNVVDALIADGRTVRVLDTRAPERDDVEYHEVDILDVDSLAKAIDGTDATFHRASEARPDACDETQFI